MRYIAPLVAAALLTGCQNKAEVKNYHPIDEAAIVAPTSCTEVVSTGETMTCRVVATHVLDQTARQGGMKGRYQVMDYDLTMTMRKDQLQASQLSLVMEQPESTAKLTFRGNFTKPLEANITWRPSFELAPSSQGKVRVVSHVHPGIARFDADLPGFVSRIIRDQMNVYEAWQKELATVASAALTTAQTKLKANSSTGRPSAQPGRR